MKVHIWSVLEELLSFPPEGATTSVAGSSQELWLKEGVWTTLTPYSKEEVLDKCTKCT